MFILRLADQYKRVFFQEYDYLVHYIGVITMLRKYDLVNKGRGINWISSRKKIEFLSHILHKIKFHIDYWPKSEK